MSDKKKTPSSRMQAGDLTRMTEQYFDQFMQRDTAFHVAHPELESVLKKRMDTGLKYHDNGTVALAIRDENFGERVALENPELSGKALEAARVTAATAMLRANPQFAAILDQNPQAKVVMGEDGIEVNFGKFDHRAANARTTKPSETRAERGAPGPAPGAG